MVTLRMLCLYAPLLVQTISKHYRFTFVIPMGAACHRAPSKEVTAAALAEVLP